MIVSERSISKKATYSIIPTIGQSGKDTKLQIVIARGLGG